MNVLVVVEDDLDIQFLVQSVFMTDRRFSVLGGAESAEEGLQLARTAEPGLVVLDHGLTGALTGLEAAPLFKKVAPKAKIILFTAHDELRVPAEAEPAVDEFLLKTDVSRLLSVAQRLSGYGPRAN